jgi:superfamily II DNA or RNA helicase
LPNDLPMQMNTISLAPGSRVIIRDAEWVIRRVDSSFDGGQQLTCGGISELVRGREAIFLSRLEDDIQVLDPGQTELVADTSAGYQNSLLYMESLLRQAVPSDEQIHIAHKAAMDLVPYQLDPALQALKQPRQRILIADGVGLGKTLEAGILVSELIRRGRGKRILVLALKSMLTQFQKEFWNRFSIPLTRLDSLGLQRVRNRIPANHNPFYYYDRSIISIDTLKQDTEYRVYLEQAYWDIIIIDEAHNVAERGSSSLRSRLARLLATRSDTLIMLSATPHDGKARSFASLMNMLDPTAIADPDNYAKADFSNKGLVVRRFKKDIQTQVEGEFKERRVSRLVHSAGSEEEAAYEALLAIPFTRAGVHDAEKPAALLRVTLQKGLFSSPAACAESVRNRRTQLQRQLQAKGNGDISREIEGLDILEQELARITPEKYAKYRALVNLLNSSSFAWSPKKKDDRLVIFSERIDTLNFLRENLLKDLRLKEDEITMLHGGLGDIDQQAIVESFGKAEAPLRVLLCSDVASEGINLHYQSHRLIHFDMPWSLMVFQQRNGRIDRYGQEKAPEIYYLLTESGHPTIRGDMRILEVLQEKDEQAYKNIGDPSAFMGVYDIEQEELITEKAVAAGTSPEEFDRQLQPKSDEGEELLALFLGTGGAAESSPQKQAAKLPIDPPLTLFANDFQFCRQALFHLGQEGASLQVTSDESARRITLLAPSDLRHRFSQLPREIVPEDWHFVLTDDLGEIKKEIVRCRQDEEAWPKIHYLWPQHPVMEWLQDRMLVAFGRHKAPVLELSQGLERDETVFVISGLIPNRKSHPLIHEWLGVCFRNGIFQQVEDFGVTLGRTQLGQRAIPNRGLPDNISQLQSLLPVAVEQARRRVLGLREQFEARINEKLHAQLAELERLRSGQHRQLELFLEQSAQVESIKAGRRRQESRRIDEIFDDYKKWIQDTLTTEKQPYLQVISVLAAPGS